MGQKNKQKYLTKSNQLCKTIEYEIADCPPTIAKKLLELLNGLDFDCYKGMFFIVTTIQQVNSASNLFPTFIFVALISVKIPLLKLTMPKIRLVVTNNQASLLNNAAEKTQLNFVSDCW